MVARGPAKNAVHEELFWDTIERTLFIKCRNVRIQQRVELENSSVKPPKKGGALYAQGSHCRKLGPTQDEEERRVNALSIPPGLQNRWELRSLLNQVWELVQDE